MKKVGHNYILNLLYQLLMVILPLITAPYISRTIGAEGIGINAFTATIAQYFVIVAVLGTATYGNREIAYHQNDKEARSQIFWGITFVSWISATIALVSYIIVITFLKSYHTIYLLQGLLILTSLFDISWYFMGRENFRVIVFRNFLIKIITLICILIFIKTPLDLTKYVAISTIGGFLGSLSLWPYLRKEIFKPKFKALNLSVHFKYTLALFLPQIMMQVYTILNRNMIGAFDSIRNLGYYNQADTLIKAVLSVITAFSTVMLPHIAKMHAQNQKKRVKELIVKSFNIISGLSIALFFGLAGIALNFAPFFWGEDFIKVGILIFVQSPFLIFISWNYIIGGQYLLATNKIKIYSTSIIIAAIVSLITNLILIPTIGVVGASISAILSEFSIFIYQRYNTKEDFSNKELFNQIWKYLLSGLIMFIIIFEINQTFKMNVVQLILQVFLGAIIYIFMNFVLKTKLWEYFYSLLSKIIFKNFKKNL
ncbi:oligosaccharide flippase family protein [Lactococcus lactis]|uniref:oligosaccharide flippase family protein n=1 Tax=Lactococcus lactis TaxID=1358 RepID=UPI001F0E9A35|nr:oligosaccharide flippase family protein [Lactococcus lactis]UMU17253.1 oligosaccharide flippase family protein [Lactococcus lactis subsp. lactis]